MSKASHEVTELLVQLFQSLGTWLSRRSDKRLKK